MKSKIVFFGNTKYSLIGLKIIHRNVGVSQVVTITDSPVEKFAAEQKIPLILARKIDNKVVEELRKLMPDLFVVEDYGLILPDELLAIPKLAPLNIHHSLLPKYRGPSPVPSAILAGEKITGVTIIKMSKDVDAGDILAQTEYEMANNETADSLLRILNELGANLLVEVIKNYGEASVHAQKQGKSPTPYTDRMTRQTGFVDINNPPNSEQLDRMIRAYYPWPGTWFKTELNGKEKMVKLLPEGKIQVEGKNVMKLADFANGYPEGQKTLLKLGLN